jgi:nucleoside 2-deoxyribosyltransferase
MSEEDWVSSMSEEERDAWDEIVKHTREETIHKMMESAFVVSIVPEEADVKWMIELGAAIMLDKPLMLVVTDLKQKLPPKLERVADQVVIADLDTEEGRQIMLRMIEDFRVQQNLRD